MNSIAEAEFLRQRLHGVREGRGEQQRLARRRTALDDLADVELEAHIEHPVRLIQDHELRLVQLNQLLLQEIHHAAGSRAHTVGVLLRQRPFLRLGVALPPKNLARAKPGRLTELHGLLVDLVTELTGRRDHQNVRMRVAVLVPAGRGVPDFFQLGGDEGGDQESEGFTRTRLGDAWDFFEV